MFLRLLRYWLSGLNFVIRRMPNWFSQRSLVKTRLILNNAAMFSNLYKHQFTLRYIYRVGKFYIYINAMLGLTLVGFILLVIGIKTASSQNHLISELLSYSPISIYDIVSFCKWYFVVSTGWIAMVLINHWTDVLSILNGAALDGSIWHTLGAAWGFAYVTTLSMGSDFLLTLLTDPANLGTTVAIKEILIFGNFCTNTIVYFYGMLPPLGIPVVITDFIVHSWTFITSSIISVISNCWSWLVSGIADIITPVVPTVIEPVVRSVFRSIASGLAAGIVIWILRLLGFPF